MILLCNSLFAGNDLFDNVKLILLCDLVSYIVTIRSTIWDKYNVMTSTELVIFGKKLQVQAIIFAISHFQP